MAPIVTSSYSPFPSPQPLIVIVGPTASGKTNLAIEVAKRIHGEIICADSRTIYKGMDIGTAKPTPEERAGVPHSGLDLVEPGVRFTAADFQQYAFRKIAEIQQRNYIPILVGGSGLYIDAVLFNYQFSNDYNTDQRDVLQKMTIKQLQQYCNDKYIPLPVNLLNKRHLIRAIEQGGINNKKTSEISVATTIVGISVEKEVLRNRIQQRAEKMIRNGVVNETTYLAKKYGWDSEAMTASIYRLVHLYLKRELTEAELLEKIIYSDLHLAKRQMTWFKRNPYITWSSNVEFLSQKCISSVN